MLPPHVSIPIDPDFPKTLPALLVARSQATPEQPFLFFPERSAQTNQITYAQLARQCFAFANWLTGQKFHGQGQPTATTVGLLMPNIPEFLTGYWGAMCAGCIAVPINTLLKSPEVQFILDNAQCKVVLTTRQFLPILAPCLPQLPHLKTLIIADDPTVDAGLSDDANLNPVNIHAPQQAETSNLSDVLDLANVTSHSNLPEFARALAPQITPETVAEIIYTSGTTGNPKGVMLTHQNLITDAYYIKTWFSLTPHSRMLCILPLFHVNGEVVTMMTPLVAGSSVVLHRQFSASRFWQDIAQYQVELFSTVPTILSILIKARPDAFQKPDSLRLGICGAAPLPPEVQTQFEACFNVPIIEGYGLSETTCYSSFNPPDIARRKLGSIGLAVGNQMAIVNTAGQVLPSGQIGEIAIRGENVMLGYFNNPDATQKALLLNLYSASNTPDTQQHYPGPWFLSGDLGDVDDAGFFRILGRSKEMIIRGGENIYPKEVDDCLYLHPAVEHAATVGIEDTKYGETVKSFVVLKPGFEPTEALAETLMQWTRTRMADFKCPEAIAFVDEIPKGPTGKLLRRALKTL
ncbi:MAG: class I adenylate-forming enzyme family protein [Vampirovibrionales bacterium]|nr:class I adenylate-forming enzyme family protein [Vampirovibrionales bacterium]